jgi:hypothetical protein
MPRKSFDNVEFHHDIFMCIGSYKDISSSPQPQSHKHLYLMDVTMGVLEHAKWA